MNVIWIKKVLIAESDDAEDTALNSILCQIVFHKLFLAHLETKDHLRKSPIYSYNTSKIDTFV